jgi:hypothetical protein
MLFSEQDVIDDVSMVTSLSGIWRNSVGCPGVEDGCRFVIDWPEETSPGRRRAVTSCSDPPRAEGNEKFAVPGVLSEGGGL